MSQPLRALRLLGLLAVMIISSQVPIPAFAAATYTMTLQTDAPSYSGSQPVTITGVISPAPGPNTAVIIMVKNSAGSLADINEVFPNLSDGSFQDVSHPGGNPAWTSGTFSVNATWGGNGATASQVVTFAYSAGATSTSTSSTSTTKSSTTTTSSTTSTTTTSTSTTQTTSTTTSTTSSTAAAPATSTTKSTSTVVTSTTPEFPSSMLAIVALAVLALVAVLSRRTNLRPLASG